MNLLDIISNFNRKRNIDTQEDTLENWDSRKEARTYYYQTKTPESFTRMLLKYSKYATFKNCFINGVFLTQVLPYIEKNFTFENCSFEVTNFQDALVVLLYNNFKNCTFYVANSSKNFPIKNYPELQKLFKKSKNQIISMSYVEYIASTNDNDLTLVNPDLLKGVSINDTDLSNVKLPKNKDFFENLNDRYIYKVKLPLIDFNNYNVNLLKFSGIDFNPLSIFSTTMLTIGITNSLLPHINFNTFDNSNNIFHFNECIFNEHTIFPKNTDFFTKNFISRCTLPKYNYKPYCIRENTFSHSVFHEEAVLPDSYLTPESINFLNNLDTIPYTHLPELIRYGRIPNIDSFLDKYKHVLAEEDLYILQSKKALDLNSI